MVIENWSSLLLHFILHANKICLIFLLENHKVRPGHRWQFNFRADSMGLGRRSFQWLRMRSFCDQVGELPRSIRASNYLTT